MGVDERLLRPSDERETRRASPTPPEPAVQIFELDAWHTQSSQAAHSGRTQHQPPERQSLRKKKKSPQREVCEACCDLGCVQENLHAIQAFVHSSFFFRPLVRDSRSARCCFFFVLPNYEEMIRPKQLLLLIRNQPTYQCFAFEIEVQNC